MNGFSRFPASTVPPCGMGVLAEKRVYPSILINKSGTRREELLLEPAVLQKVWILRKFLYNMDEIEALEFMLDKMRATKNNAEFFDSMKKG